MLEGLLEGTGKNMRHVKLRAGESLDSLALGEPLGQLIDAAYVDLKLRLRVE